MVILQRNLLVHLSHLPETSEVYSAVKFCSSILCSNLNHFILTKIGIVKIYEIINNYHYTRMKNSTQIKTLKKDMKTQSDTCPRILNDILTFAIFVTLCLPCFSERCSFLDSFWWQFLVLLVCMPGLHNSFFLSALLESIRRQLKGGALIMNKNLVLRPLRFVLKASMVINV